MAGGPPPRSDGHEGSIRLRADRHLRREAGPPRSHSLFESAVYVLSGRAIHHWGERLEHAIETAAGDFLFIAPGVPH